MWTVRAYQAEDQDDVMALAHRLSVGAPPWRDPRLWLASVRGWVRQSIAAIEDGRHAMFVAADGARLAGFVSVSSREHFTGAVDAYIGELVVAEWAEGRGAGQPLLEAAEQWGITNGHQRLTLETGAANHRALRFYERGNYRAEDVRLTKLLG